MIKTVDTFFKISSFVKFNVGCSKAKMGQNCMEVSISNLQSEKDFFFQ